VWGESPESCSRNNQQVLAFRPCNRTRETQRRTHQNHLSNQTSSKSFRFRTENARARTNERHERTQSHDDEVKDKNRRARTDPKARRLPPAPHCPIWEFGVSGTAAVPRGTRLVSRAPHRRRAPRQQSCV